MPAAHAGAGRHLIRSLLATLLLLAPLAAALPSTIDGAPRCAAADAELDAYADDTWYEFCVGITSAQADARDVYTQTTLSCGSNSCTYAPVFHVALDTMAPGEWILRGTSRIQNYPSGSTLSGSTRSTECRIEGPAPGHCEAAIDNKLLTAGNFNSYRWSGEWSLFLVDATGAEHLQATGANNGWLAQYYQG